MGTTTDLLVEIGCEELPPKALARLAAEFEDRLAAALLVERALGSSLSRTQRFFGPRRIAVLVTDLETVQPERTLERSGPARAAAYDAAGKPTKAAEGFARSCGVALESLGEKDGKLHFRAQVPGRPAAELVPDAVRAALDALPIPKRMRWGAGDTQFVRPVHWIVLLLGDTALQAEVYGVHSGRTTRGHRFHHPGPIELQQPRGYVEALRRVKVFVDDADGTLDAEIVRQAREAAARTGGALLPHVAERDPARPLVAEVAALTEWPVVLEGRFDPAFLRLPPEVLISTIEGNQRYFLLTGPDGALLPRFLFVANLESRDPKQVVAGNERVIVPRLTDAVFFWDQDRKLALADRAGGLEGVVFQRELGSYAAKSARVGALGELIAGALGVDPGPVGRAARLAKCDLLTALVGEFPELQGTIGRHLAADDGEPAEVAAALEEQYLPRFAGDRLPETATGRVLALAEKLDTVCGIFAIGQRPTGDKDPYALRRLALGAMRIVIESGLDLDLGAMIDAAYRAVKPDAAPDEVSAAAAFFVERLRAYHAERGIRADVFDAVVAQAPLRPLDIDARLGAVNAFLELPEAQSLAAANKRIANILRQAGADAVAARIDAGKLVEPAERALYELLDSGEVAWIEGLLASGSYESALRKLAALKGPVDAFFDGVMVMADDPAVRANRLALLARTRALFLHVADVGMLQVD